MTQTHFQPMADSVFQMIDVSEKKITRRRALAQGKIWIPSSVVERIKNKDMPKGDVLALAEVAGIMAAKNTAQILPLCHPLQLSSVRLRCKVQHDSIEVTSEVICEAKTGVEMEALVSVTAALLCIYDLTKMIEPELHISDISLLLKEGGKSGKWSPKQGERS